MNLSAIIIGFSILSTFIGTVSAEAIGEKPEAEQRKDFLRKSIVSLNPKQKEISIGIGYNNRSSLLEKSREVATFLEYRFGVSKRDEAYINIPMSSTHTEFLDVDSNIGKENEKSIKNFELGWKHNFSSLSSNSLELIGTVSITSSHKNSSNEWNKGVSANLIALKSYDPIIIYAGAGIQHSLSEGEATNKNTFIYSAGLGFAVTNKISLSGQITGAYQKTLEKENNGKLSSEPTLLRIGLTNRINNKSYIEPFVKFGLNNDSPSTGFGIRYTRRF